MRRKECLRHGNVSVVSEESEGILKSSGYADSQTEKAVR